MNPLRSVGTRLGLALAIVVAAALALVDLIVVPSLERNLVHAKIAQLRDAAPAIAAQYESKSAVIDPQPVLQAASESASARISVFTRLDPQTLINRSRRILWLVTGGDKVAMLRRLLDGDKSIPAARMGQDRAVVIADSAAAEQLEPS